MTSDRSSIRFRRARTLLRLGRARLIHQADRAFLQPVLTLVTGTALAHVLVLAARPVLTRLFDAEAFGVLTVFIALSAVVTSLTAGRFEDALMLPRRRTAAANLFVLALGLTVVSASVVLLALPFADSISMWFGGGEMVAAIIWLPVAVLCLGSSLVLESWHTRAHRYGLLSAGRTAQSAVVVVVQVGAGILALGAVGLVIGTAAGFAVAATILGIAAWIKDRGLGRALSVTWMWRLAGRYARFPRYAAPATLLNNLASRAPVLLLALLFTTEVVGHFGIAFGTLALPVGLATGAIGQVFFVKAAEALREGQITDLTRRVFRQLLTVSVYPMLVVAAAGPTLFEFVFGPGWGVAGEYARWLAPWLLFASLAPPLTRIFDVLERQRADLTFSIALFTVQTGTIIAAGLMSDALTTLALASLAGAVMRIGQIGYLLHLASVPVTEAARDLIRTLGLALPSTAIILATDVWTGSGPITLMVAVLGGGLYLILLHRASAKRSG